MSPSLLALLMLASLGCDSAAVTSAVLENGFPAGQGDAYVVYRARCGAAVFGSPVVPGASSDAVSTVASSPNTAYALVAPGWDASSRAAPGSFLLLQSRAGFGVGLGDTLHLPVDDATFTGDCAAGHPLTQAQADFLAEQVFATELGGWRYDAATCTLQPGPGFEAGAD